MMTPRLLAVFLLAVTFGLGGCATRTPMAFEKDTDRLSEKSKPVYLMTATIKNVYKTGFQPKVIVVHVEKPDAKEAADRINFVMDDKARNEVNTPEAGNSYLWRFEMDPGTYQLRGVTSMASAVLIHGTFYAPLNYRLEVKEAGVYYLGHLDATVRERQGNEFRAGGPMPLIDQAVSGASGGTFDIQVTDRWATDEALFRAKFPALAGIVVKPAVLPAFDRAAAQREWENN